MKAPIKGKEFFEYTLMPMHMNCLFRAHEFQNAELTSEFKFTKDFPVMKLKGTSNWFETEDIDVYTMKDELYNVECDPLQKNNIIEDTEVVMEMKEKLLILLKVNEAPKELYERYGLERTLF